ncbi:hypothetical protein [Candidatus Chromulinivorax destructor]|uniref:Uncharacterized protein n=1 Tax=Candidatus Chromulinivorax destructor TaxID=2066483 RepID=A0A345ZCM6_9BACT|nr:hypothetical protein [Candidatus Chromulinivorax destructor]AXK61043.1 hypothetical protein C0J27_04910 [Candidatus Chromulinivorax destructor]
MSIKKNAKSTLLTALLVSSLSCGLQASDMIEEEGTRLQITGSYNLLSAEIAAVQASLAAVPSVAQASADKVAALAISPVINAFVLTGTGAGTYNSAVAALAPLITTALATPNNANILAVQTSINAPSTGLLAAAAGQLLTPYVTASVLAAANELNVAVNAWLAAYPA